MFLLFIGIYSSIVISIDALNKLLVQAYISILYLRKFKNFDIILRGKPVQQYNILDDLKFLEVLMYRPQLGKASKEVRCGYNADFFFLSSTPVYL